MAKSHTIIDNFNDNAADTAKWLVFANPLPATERIREVNGRVEITPRGNDVGQYSGYQTVTDTDLTESQVHVELVRALRTASGAEATFVVSASSNSLRITIAGGSLKCYQVVAGTYTLLATVPYDPAQHRWLRFRERSGTTYWEVSADGQDWTTVFSKANPITLTAVKVTLQAGLNAAVPAPGVAIFDNFNVIDTSRARRVEERRLSAREVREKAAEVAAGRLHSEPVNNNDEVNYPDWSFIGNYSKSLKHDSLGDPEPISYGTLLRALESRDPADFEEIRLASSMAVKLTNPQSGLAFDIEGPDAQELTMPPAPRFDSEQSAHEAGELYWMAVLRDVPFSQWSTSNTDIAAAINSLNSEFPKFGGTAPVTVQNLFRGIYPGEQTGPYVSQFLLKGNVDPRKPDGQGRDADEGYITYGTQVIDQRILPPRPGVDYLTDTPTWLEVQNGVDKRGLDAWGIPVGPGFDFSRRFLYTLRFGTAYVHFDQVLNAYYNAAWILMSEPTGNQLSALTGTGRPTIDLEFPKDQGNPYDPPGDAMDSKTQSGFATFGPTHLLQVLGEVLGRALRAVWWQKWGVHRRLRPEEYGGRVHNHIKSLRLYPLHTSITDSLKSGGLAPYFGNAGEKFPSSYLLPQAYPEGAPTHPAYGAGHATGSGACTTILKAFFDESTPIENPVQPSSDGLSLAPYISMDAADMTVGGELNKLAGNIAIFRNAAGVHWRSDYTDSLPLGEAVAIRLLQEMSLTFNEDDAFFELTRFDGQKIRIFDGKVVPID
jgi:hypothetical protein